jgi:hypothetical protein
VVKDHHGRFPEIEVFDCPEGRRVMAFFGGFGNTHAKPISIADARVESGNVYRAPKGTDARAR